ncbi:MAG TPA: hypothetical protein PLY72_02990 [Candidatus Obscuribacter sp.]|nr:hypothetical protein [Candidatus Obscuribacter sp.]
MLTLPVLIAVFFSVGGFQVVSRISQSKSGAVREATLLALIIYLVSTQSLGYILFQEPQSTQYFLGWVLGAMLCVSGRLVGIYREKKRQQRAD